jgi:hypothetical protein
MMHVLLTEILSSQVNPDMVPEFENAGLQFVGKDDTGRRMEVCVKLRLALQFFLFS